MSGNGTQSHADLVFTASLVTLLLATIYILLIDIDVKWIVSNILDILDIESKRNKNRTEVYNLVPVQVSFKAWTQYLRASRVPQYFF